MLDWESAETLGAVCGGCTCDEEELVVVVEEESMSNRPNRSWLSLVAWGCPLWKPFTCCWPERTSHVVVADISPFIKLLLLPLSKLSGLGGVGFMSRRSSKLVCKNKPIVFQSLLNDEITHWWHNFSFSVISWIVTFENIRVKKLKEMSWTKSQPSLHHHSIEMTCGTRI